MLFIFILTLFSDIYPLPILQLLIHYFTIMWTYNKQIVVRWVSFIIGLLLIGLLVAHLFRLHPENLGKPELKEFFTQLSVNAEFLPLYAFPAIFLVIYCLMLLGCPSFLVFPPMYMLTGFMSAFIFTIAAQLLASVTTIYYSRKKGYGSSVPNGIISNIIASGTSAAAFSFWTRLYINYPQRSIDLICSALLRENENNSRVFLPTLAATVLRNLLPAIWASSLIHLVSEISANHAAASSGFLLWSSLLVAYIALPKVPELLICQAKIKPVLEDIESWSSSSGSSADSARRSRNKIKLGMQSRPSL